MIPESAGAASPRNLLKMQVSRFNLDLLIETLEAASPAVDSDA